ncbi:MAG: aspartate/glutamate racemase family protein [Pseudomonadota bacterium]
MTLIVINPNSSEHVTEGIDRAVEPLRRLGHPIRCVTLAEGPPGIESQAQADETIPHMLRLAAGLENEATGFVIACFGDPGLHALRDRTDKPVFGIQECAVLTAMTKGQRFGVIAILDRSIPRHLRSFGAMGVMNRFAGDRALDLGVGELSDAVHTYSRMVEVGEALRDEDGADTVILGCAGMADYRASLEADLGIPVIDPCQAAVSMAVGQIALSAEG